MLAGACVPLHFSPDRGRQTSSLFVFVLSWAFVFVTYCFLSLFISAQTWCFLPAPFCAAANIILLFFCQRILPRSSQWWRHGQRQRRRTPKDAATHAPDSLIDHSTVTQTLQSDWIVDSLMTITIALKCRPDWFPRRHFEPPSTVDDNYGCSDASLR